MQLKILQQKQA